MDLLKPVRWTEGMFLRPQHFQHHERQLEAREVGYLDALERYRWGWITLEIDESALTNYALSIRRMRAILPDGALVDVPFNARALARKLDAKSFDRARLTEVKVGIRMPEDRRSQARSDQAGGTDARYVASIQEIYDVESAADSAEIETLQYEVRVFLGDEPTHGYDTLPLGAIEATGDPTRPIAFADRVVPPCLRVSASRALFALLQSVRGRVETALREFSHARAGDKVRDLIIYQALASSYPVLRELARDGAVHPRLAHQEIARLVGALYFQDTSKDSLDDIPQYDHEAPGPGFEELRRLVELLSKEIITNRPIRVPMRRDTLGLFRAALPAEGRDRKNRFFLEIEAAESKSHLGELMSKARVGSPSQVQIFENLRVPGIVTEALPGPPSGLPPPHPGAYYALSLRAGEWETVVQAGELGLLITNAPSDLKFTFLIILPDR